MHTALWGPVEKTIRMCVAPLTLHSIPSFCVRACVCHSSVSLSPLRSCEHRCVVASLSRMARLAVDTRERMLMKHLDAQRVPYRAVTLSAGDVLCTYEGCDSSWIMERKRADDFAASIQACFCCVACMLYISMLRTGAGESRPPACFQPVIGFSSALKVIFDGLVCTSRCLVPW